jgi:hypothetical protein
VAWIKASERDLDWGVVDNEGVTPLHLAACLEVCCVLCTSYFSLFQPWAKDGRNIVVCQCFSRLEKRGPFLFGLRCTRCSVLWSMFNRKPLQTVGFLSHRLTHIPITVEEGDANDTLFFTPFMLLRRTSTNPYQCHHPWVKWSGCKVTHIHTQDGGLLAIHILRKWPQAGQVWLTKGTIKEKLTPKDLAEGACICWRCKNINVCR